MVHRLHHSEDHTHRVNFPDFIEHLFDTIAALGGLKGLLIFTFAILCFYLYVLRTISKRHDVNKEYAKKYTKKK